MMRLLNKTLQITLLGRGLVLLASTLFALFIVITLGDRFDPSTRNHLLIILLIFTFIDTWIVLPRVRALRLKNQ